jgi:hypothetical protein
MTETKWDRGIDSIAMTLLQHYWIIDFVCHLTLFGECVLTQDHMGESEECYLF